MPDLDQNDFAKGGIFYANEPDGRFGGLPLLVDYWVVYWNKELFDAKGVEYPTNFAEMVDAARKAERPGQWRLRALSPAASRTPTSPVWASLLLGYGGGIVEDGKLKTERPKRSKRQRCTSA